MTESQHERWVVRRYLENVRVILLAPPCLILEDGLHVRPVLESERKSMYRKAGYLGEDGFDRDIDSQMSVIETSVLLKQNLRDSPEYRSALRKIDTVFFALLLYRDRLVKQMGRIESRGRPVSIDGTEKLDYFANQSTDPSWLHWVASHHQLPLEFDLLDHPQDFPQFWAKIDRMYSNNALSHFQTALERFGMASQMAGIPGRRTYRFVDYVTAMESLLTANEPELSFQLATRMATLVGRSPKERQDVFDFMRKVYDIRSKLVHGEDPYKVLPLKVRGVEIELEEAIGRLHSYSRDCLRHVADLSDAGLNKEQLLRLLNLAMLRKDIQDMVVSFLGGQAIGQQLSEKLKEAENEPFYKELHTERYKALASARNSKKEAS